MPRKELNLGVARKRIAEFIRKKVEDAKADGAVIGISGGIDSAVAAYLSVDAVGNRRVLGLIMPDRRVTPREDIEDATEITDELGIQTKYIDIAPIHESFMKNLEPNRLSEGNLRARIRMSILYYHANLSNRVVVGTGDRSESYLGYFTKWGDGGVDILPIGDLYKTEVRKMGEILGISRRIISKRSSPRLWPGQTAEGELGMTYEVIDSVFKLYIDQKLSPKTVASRLGQNLETVEKLVSKYHETAHKRELPEICKVH